MRVYVCVRVYVGVRVCVSASMKPAASQLLPESFESELRRTSLRHSPLTPHDPSNNHFSERRRVTTRAASSEPLLLRTPPCHNPNYHPLTACSPLPQRATTLPRIVTNAAAQHAIALQLVPESVDQILVGTAVSQLLPESFALLVLILPLRHNSC